MPLLGNLPLDLVLHPKRSVLDADFALLEREVAQIFRTARAKAAQPHTAAAINAGRPPVQHKTREGAS